MVSEAEEEYGNYKGMSLRAFSDKAEQSLKEYFGQEVNIISQMVRKNNGIVLHGLTVSYQNHNVAPTLYMEDFYDAYRKGIPYSEIIQKLIHIFEGNKQERDMDIDFFSHYDKVKKKLGYKLIHYQMNEKLLEEVPHERFLDLALICYCVVMNDQIGNGSILIHNEHLRVWNISEEELIRDAKENMPRIFKADCMNMADVLEGMLRENDELMAPVSMEEFRHAKPRMYVLGNKNRLFGASSILYKNVLEEIAKEFESDFYILPSSIHEVILIAKDESIREEYLSQMVQEVNLTQLTPDEVLSNHAYLYSCQDHAIHPLPLIPE